MLAEGVENFKKFFKFIKDFQEIQETEIRIIIMTGLSFESAKNKYRLMNQLAESSGLPNLFYGIVIEHCGFFMNKEKTIQLKSIDPRLIEKRTEIEIIANKYDVEINNNYIYIYNLFFNKKIARSELAQISEMLDDAIDCDDIEIVSYYDRYGCEIDIKNKENSKANAVLMLVDSLKTEYDIPVVVMGGAPLKNDWDMYKNSKNELNKIGCDVIDIITLGFEETKEIDYDDKNVISLDLSKYDNISKLFVEINSRLNMKNRGI